jgi:hypothetical protein
MRSTSIKTNKVFCFGFNKDSLNQKSFNQIKNIEESTQEF